MEKRPSSTYIIRFTDCDPFGHLNNARYLDYFLNAREDHIRQHYNMDLATFYKQGISWFVGGHEIVYIKPANYNETVRIQSSLIEAAEDGLLVELLMTNEEGTHIKSIMWTRFIPVNIKTGRKENHTPEFMDFLRQVHNDEVPVSDGLKKRVSTLISELKRAVVSGE
jgi:YbgC/YbaW family acyl-CoA thioester hydrolase